MAKINKQNPLKTFNDSYDKKVDSFNKNLKKFQGDIGGSQVGTVNWGMQKATNNPDSAVTTVRQVNTKQGPRFYGAVGKDDQTVRAQLDAKMNAKKDSIPAKDVEAFINKHSKNYKEPTYISTNKTGGATKSKKKK
jgi:hypothetical protein